MNKTTSNKEQRRTSKKIAVIVGLVLLMVLTTLTVSTPEASARPSGGWCARLHSVNQAGEAHEVGEICGNRTAAECQVTLTQMRIDVVRRGRAIASSGSCISYVGLADHSQAGVAVADTPEPVKPGPVRLPFSDHARPMRGISLFGLR